MSNKYRGFAAAAVAAAVAVVLCLSLFHWDNKYTRPGAQPINGLLLLSEQELQEHPLRYLIREWEYWPGVLLTPEQAGTYDGYRRYVSIGETSALEEGSGHGRGTYRLRLALPQEEREYALELPEVFSACRLYLNGEPVLQLGDPESGRAGIASRVISFSAAGEAELLLEVSDRSGVSSGMTYPPAFGTAEAVSHARELRLLLHGAGVLLALSGGALAACFGLQGNRRRGFLLLLACLCCAVLTGYPVLHGLAVTGYQPWYSLEFSALYAFLLLAVLLQCELYGLWGRPAAYLCAPCGLGLLAAVARVGGAAWWNTGMAAVFSVLSAGLKFYAAACLIVLAAWAVRRGLQFSAPLLCASVGLGVCLVMDRLLPLYEPVCGGWFEEIGAVALAVALGAALWLDAMDAYRFRLAFSEQYRQMERQVALQKEHYRQLSRQIELARQSAHDLRHHMRLLRSMAEQGQSDRLLAYLNEYDASAAGQTVATFSENPVADAILAHYDEAAQALGARRDLRLSLPPEECLPDVELCILLGNLLENAAEALSREPRDRRSLYLRGDAEGGQLRLVVENSFTGALRERGGAFLSTKHVGVGIGVRAVRTIVEKYGGLADFSADGSIFRAQLLIPLPAAGKAAAAGAPAAKAPTA